MARGSGTIGVEQKRPMRTPGVAKVAVTACSQAATSWQPAAVGHLDLRHHGLRQRVQPEHHVGADRSSSS